LRVIPTSSFSAVWHKFRLITASETVILDSIWPRKFEQHSDTHALADSHGVPKVIHTTNPSNAHAILVTNFADWGPTPRRSETLYPLAPEALGTTDGPAWVHNRKMVMKHVGTFRVKDTRSNEAAIQLLFDAIGAIDVDGWTRNVDLMDLFLRMALDMTTEYLLGTSFGSQVNGIRDRTGTSTSHQQRKKYGLTWEQAFEIAKNYMSWRAKLGSKAWLADSPRYRQACNALNAFIDELISRAIEGTAKSDVDDAVAAARFGLVGNLVRERGADPVKIRDFVIDILIAGQNMTGVMAAWIFARMEVHREWFGCVREEVLRSFGAENEAKLPMTWDNLKACKGLQNVIQECLRLYPLLPAIGRSAKQDTILPTGGGPDGTQPIAVPKGAAATINLYIMHRRRDIWGKDAWKFNPDRWTGRKVGKSFAPL
jgi:cytochrome P450